MSVARKAVVGVAAVALVGAAAAPANAEKQTFDDKRGDVHHGFDIQTVHVRNNGAKVRVWIHFRNLRRDRLGGVSAYLDTRRKNRGPEFAVGGAVGGSGEYELVRAPGWKGVGDWKPCRGLRFHVNFRHDRVRMAIPRRCLDKHTRAVRAAVRAKPNRGPGDWAPRFHRFYPKVAYR